MKVKVNEDACIGCGACQAICEEVFEINDEGISCVKTNTVKDENIEEVNDAIESCPTGAIEEVKEDENIEKVNDAIESCPTGAIEEVKEDE